MSEEGYIEPASGDPAVGSDALGFGGMRSWAERDKVGRAWAHVAAVEWAWIWVESDVCGAVLGPTGGPGIRVM